MSDHLKIKKNQLKKLESICNDLNLEFNILQNLLLAEKDKQLFRKRSNIQQIINKELLKK